MNKEQTTVTLNKGSTLQNKQGQLSRLIYGKILNNQYSGRLPGLRDLAAEYGANIKTVRKSLEPLLESGVLSLEHGKGIFVVGNAHRCIGIVSIGCESVFFKSTYFSSVFSSALPTIEGKGDFFSYQRKEVDVPYSEMFKNNTSVDGVLCFAPSDDDLEQLKELQKVVPVIVVGSDYSGKGINFIDTDNFEASRNAVKILCQRGHRRISFIGNPLNLSTSRLRLKGYMAALEEYGIAYDPSLVFSEYIDKNVHVGRMREVFLGKNPPTALFGASPNGTSKTLTILAEQSGNISRLLEVIMYDFDSLIKTYGLKGGFVKQPLGEIGEMAINKLYALMDGSEDKVSHIFKAGISVDF